MNNEYNKYTRNLDLSDLFFAGFGFIIGAGIFTLMPLIIKYGKGSSWLSFVVGGFVCLLTGLSYAKLNQEYPSNDAEYSWIYEILNFNKPDEKGEKAKPNILVRGLANAIIWIVMIIGLFNTATVAVGLSSFVTQYLNIPKTLMVASSIALPSLINVLGNKYSTVFNKGIMSAVVGCFVVLMGLAGFKGSNFSENSVVPSSGDFSGILRSSFITIFAYNGFQSIVQLSEEARNVSDIPKAIYSAIGTSTGLYATIAISVIALLGIKTASNSVNPIASALDKLIPNSKIDYHFVNGLSSVALFNTLMLIVLSRSRLLQKLSVRGLAPKVFSKLTNIGELLGIENFKTEKNGDKEERVTIPIFAIVAVALVSFALTFIKEGAIESLATLTNSFIFIVFVIVHSLVIINHHKKNNEPSQLKKYPWYAVLGLALSGVYLVKGFSYN